MLGAMLTGRPVKYAYDREEEMQVSSPRAAERIYIKDGVMNDGRIVARQIRLYVDAGAYSRHSPYGTTKAAAHMPGPYTIPNVQVDAHCVYTNRTPSSAMRGFGVTIGDFALEVQMDKIARLLGMDPIEFRILNAYRDGDMKAHGEVTKGAALVETMQAAAQLAGWPVSREKAMRAQLDEAGRLERIAQPSHTSSSRTRCRRRSSDTGPRLPRTDASPSVCSASLRCCTGAAGRTLRFAPRAESVNAEMAKARGRGVAAVNYPTGMNLGGDPSQALVHATTTGNFVVSLSSADLGQGLRTVMTQICAETIGVPPEMVIIDTADTDTGPHCMGTFASRGTHRIGNAIIMAAKEARRRAPRRRGGRARGERRRPRDRRQGRHPRQGRAVEVDPRLRGGARRALQARQDGFRPRHLHADPLLPRSRDGEDDPGRRPTPMPAPSPRSRSTPRPARSRCCR